MYSRDHRSTVKKLSSSKIKNCTAKKKSYYEKSAKLNNAFSDTIKIMNYIKTNAFHLRVFSLCDNMEADHKQLRWYTRYTGYLGEKFCRECLHIEETQELLIEKKHVWAQFCKDMY